MNLYYEGKLKRKVAHVANQVETGISPYKRKQIIYVLHSFTVVKAFSSESALFPQINPYFISSILNPKKYNKKGKKLIKHLFKTSKNNKQYMQFDQLYERVNIEQRLITISCCAYKILLLILIQNTTKCYVFETLTIKLNKETLNIGFIFTAKG